MPVLEAQGLVTRRNGGRLGRAAYWFLTEQGREIVKEIGVDQARGP
jgi:DNA-binding MarR family transcriptional regulator